MTNNEPLLITAVMTMCISAVFVMIAFPLHSAAMQYDATCLTGIEIMSYLGVFGFVLSVVTVLMAGSWICGWSYN